MCWAGSWSDAASRELPVSLAFLDLDHFKLVNDVHGHLVGSELLARTGRRLQELSRKQDLCFRYGGDEFVILMPETGAEAALELTKATASRADGDRFEMKNGLKLRSAPAWAWPPRPPTARSARDHRRRRRAHVRREDRWQGEQVKRGGVTRRRRHGC